MMVVMNFGATSVLTDCVMIVVAVVKGVTSEFVMNTDVRMNVATGLIAKIAISTNMEPKVILVAAFVEPTMDAMDTTPTQ